MLIRKKPDIASSEITSESVYLNRRKLLHAAGLTGISLLPTSALSETIPPRYQQLKDVAKSPLSTDAPATSFSDITTYNNFYEFGTGKEDPANNSGKFQPQPWSVTIDGEAEVTGTFTYEDILKPHVLEERIYRMRCVSLVYGCAMGWNLTWRPAQTFQTNLQSKICGIRDSATPQ